MITNDFETSLLAQIADRKSRGQRLLDEAAALELSYEAITNGVAAQRAKPTKPTKPRRRIYSPDKAARPRTLAFLKERADAGRPHVTPAQLARHRGCTVDAARLTLRDLVNAGHVDRVDTGVYVLKVQP